MLHELQAQQIEMELQHTELRDSNDALELLRGEYNTLYDFSPVGYISLDHEGFILKKNLVGAALVGMVGSQLKKLPFAPFVAEEDRPILTEFLRQAFSEDSQRTTCELRLVKKGRETVFARLEAQGGRSALECLVAIVDVTKLVHSYDELEMLTAELNLSEERQRRRIALALHDQVVQSLAIGKLKLDAAVKKGEIADHPVLQELQAILETSMLDLRDLSVDLSPPILYDLGLRAAIASLGAGFEKKFGFRFTLQADLPKEEPLGEELTISVFQFCRELLVNVGKHAGATAVTVLLRLKGNRLTLSVSDDGRGFDPRNCHEGFGLASIRQRVNYLRGDFGIESRQGRGTRTEIALETQYSGKLKRESTRCR